jgi:site-specific recombinase XerD
MTISFFQRGDTINARLTDGTQVSLRLTTGIKVPHYAKFVKDKFVGTTPDIPALNNDLLRMKIQLSELYLHYKDPAKVKDLFNPKTPELAAIEDETFDIVDLARLYIKKANSGDIKSKAERKLTYNTVRAYAHAVSNLEEYSRIAGSLDLKEMSIEAGYDTPTKRKLSNKFTSFFKGLDDYMTDKQYNMKTRSGIMNCLSIIVRYWEREYFLRLPRITYAQAPENQVVVLDPQFVGKFLTDNLYDRLDTNMKYVWEVCATILITTMRLDDAVSLNVNDLHITPTSMFLSRVNGKTKATTDVPLPKFLEKIFRHNLTYHSSLFSRKPDHKLVNAKIRELFASYEEMHQIVSVRKVGVDGNYESKMAPFYEHVHPHMLRKTAITTMIYNGVSERHIKFLSGHSLKSGAFERYVAFVERNFKTEVKGYYDRLLAEQVA